VLRKLNDQILVSTEQPRILMQSMKAGDEIDLTVMRKAETIRVRTTFSEKAAATEAFFLHFIKSERGRARRALGLYIYGPGDSSAKGNGNPFDDWAVENEFLR